MFLINSSLLTLRTPRRCLSARRCFKQRAAHTSHTHNTQQQQGGQEKDAAETGGHGSDRLEYSLCCSLSDHQHHIRSLALMLQDTHTVLCTGHSLTAIPWTESTVLYVFICFFMFHVLLKADVMFPLRSKV